MEPKTPEKEAQPKELSEMLDDALVDMATFVADDQKHAPSRQQEPETIDPSAADNPIDDIFENVLPSGEIEEEAKKDHTDSSDSGVPI